MPNYIQYSTSIPSGSLKKGNAALGITDSVAGPTSNTGWYTGINPPTGSYTVYEVAASGDPDIYCPINSTELINLVRSKGARGGNTGSVAAALAWIATQPNLLATNEVYPNIVTSGSVLMLDAQFVGSYPTTGSTWYDISGNNDNGSLLNGITYNNNALVFDGIDDNVNIESYISMSNPTTVCALINRSITSSGNQVFFGPQANDQDNWLAINSNVLQLFGTQTSDVNNFSITGNTFISSSRWYFVTGMINGPSASIYLNGNLERSTTQSFNIGGWGGQAYIGLRRLTQFPFPGKISNVQAYNKALSQAEINQNYYQAPIVTNGLVLALDAGNLVSYESGSTTTYSLTGSFSGSLINGTGYNNNNGGSWVLDGADDYISISENINPSNITVEFFYKALITSPYEYLISNARDCCGTYKGYELKIVSGYPYFQIWNSTTVAVNGTLTLANQIYQITGTYDGSQLKIYQNGVLTGTVNSTLGIGSPPSFNLAVGGMGFLPSTFNLTGNIYVGRVYNRALTQSEIIQNFNAQRSRFNI
jgi:hypothetical protein